MRHAYLRVFFDNTIASIIDLMRSDFLRIIEHSAHQTIYQQQERRKKWVSLYTAVSIFAAPFSPPALFRYVLWQLLLLLPVIEFVTWVKFHWPTDACCVPHSTLFSSPFFHSFFLAGWNRGASLLFYVLLDDMLCCYNLLGIFIVASFTRTHTHIFRQFYLSSVEQKITTTTT